MGVHLDDCPNCGGSGYVSKPVDLKGESESIAFIRQKCPACSGIGQKASKPPSTPG
jgi:hypothetical protein